MDNSELQQLDAYMKYFSSLGYNTEKVNLQYPSFEISKRNQTASTSTDDTSSNEEKSAPPMDKFNSQIPQHIGGDMQRVLTSGYDFGKSGFPHRTFAEFLTRQKTASSMTEAPDDNLTDNTSSNDEKSNPDFQLSPRASSQPIAITPTKNPLPELSPFSNQSNALPPIGVFWDIENCQVPRGRSAVLIAQEIRNRFFEGYREAEFLVVCDVKKENGLVIQELNDAHVNLVHISSKSKNAADDKLRQAMRRFGEIYATPAAVVLISGDINFSADLCDLRHRKKLHVILIHNELCSKALILCANEHYNYSDIVGNLPYRGSEDGIRKPPVPVLVSNLPYGDPGKIRTKLKKLSENTGGKVGAVSQGTAIITFPTLDCANRAQQRMQKEYVFGSPLNVRLPRGMMQDPSLESGDYVDQGEYNEYGFGLTSNNNSHPPHGYYNAKLPVNGYPNGLDPRFANKGFAGNSMRQNCAFNQENSEPSQYYQSYDPNQWNFSPYKNNPSWQHEMSKRQVLATGEGNSTYSEAHFYGPNSTPPFPTNGQMENVFANFGKMCVTPDNNMNFQKTSAVGSAVPRAFSNGNPHQNHNPAPNQASGMPATQTDKGSGPVELLISNFDSSTHPNYLKSSITKMLQDCGVKVLDISVNKQGYFNSSVTVKVKNSNDARTVISQMQRRKIGSKRITIAYNNHQKFNLELVKSQIATLLSNVPGHQLPLFQFREIFEKRFYSSVSTADLYKLKDVCTITHEQNGIGRTISLNMPTFRASLETNFFQGPQITHNTVPNNDQMFCLKHWSPMERDSANGSSWAGFEKIAIPCVHAPLKQFSENIVKLVDSHNNYLFLASLPACYEAECEVLTRDDQGVPLEHLVHCVRSVELIRNANSGIKYLSRRIGGDEDKLDGALDIPSSSDMAKKVGLFSRELVEMIKTYPRCLVLLSSFVPAYHNHFGRQCRVAEYGFTKLLDLLQSLPHVVQIVGSGNMRMVTLSHRAQMRRFTSDLMRVLKSVPNRQMSLSEFIVQYGKIFNKSFNPVDYGLSMLDDLLSQVAENVVIVDRTKPGECVIKIPRKVQTPEEVKRTREFARQIEDNVNGERYISLMPDARLEVIAAQIVNLIMSRNPSGIPLCQLPHIYSWTHGFTLHPPTLGFKTFKELVESLNFAVKIDEEGTVVRVLDKQKISFIAKKVRRVMKEYSKIGKMEVSLFQAIFRQLFNEYCSVPTLQSDELSKIVKVAYDNNGKLLVQLTQLEMFARDVHLMLILHAGPIPLAAFQYAYFRYFKRSIQPLFFGYQDIIPLLEAIPDTIQLRGKAPHRFVILNAGLGDPIPATSSDFTQNASTDGQSLVGGTSKSAADSRKSGLFADTTDDLEVETLLSGNKVFKIDLPAFTLHPDTFSTNYLTSPHKSLQSNIMFGEHVLHSATSYFHSPKESEVPMPYEFEKVIGDPLDFGQDFVTSSTGGTTGLRN